MLQITRITAIATFTSILTGLSSNLVSWLFLRYFLYLPWTLQRGLRWIESIGITLESIGYITLFSAATFGVILIGCLCFLRFNKPTATALSVVAIGSALTVAFSVEAFLQLRAAVQMIGWNFSWAVQVIDYQPQRMAPFLGTITFTVLIATALTLITSKVRFFSKSTSQAHFMDLVTAISNPAVDTN